MVNFTTPDLMPAAPELFVLAMACVVLIKGLFARGAEGAGYWLTQVTLLGALALTFSLRGVEESTFGGQFVVDELAILLKTFVLLISFVVLFYSRPYLIERGLERGEYYALALFAVLGMMAMISSQHFIVLYLGLELLSLSLYAMIALDRDNSDATEAAMKYFVLGAIASGMLLYGLSLIYGLTGSLEMTGLSERFAALEGSQTALLFALSFVVAALAFKMGAAPFHMWLPDVYHGAPAAVTLFVGAAPKIAGFAIIMRLLVEGLGGLHGGWQDMLIALALLSLLVGNVIAIAQTNIKRMLAYSTISHVGFLLLGILSGNAEGYGSAVFYIVVYTLMSAGALGVVVALSRKGFEAENLDDYKGLSQRSPVLALVMMVLMFSMAGVPPTVGFYAKLAVLNAVVDVELVWLAVYAVVFAIIGAYYYLRIVKLMYFDAAVEGAAESGKTTPGVLAMLSGNGLMVLVLGFIPGGLMAWCIAAVAKL